MEALSEVPIWMFCIGGFSFVVVVAVMIVWQVIQGRMERELEQNEKAGKGMAPIQHPEPLHAWVRAACQHMTGVRLFRVALAGVTAGYLDVATAWNGIRPVAQRLQQAYPSFDAIWTDYVVSYRQWRGLPPDGSADDPQTIERLQYIAQAKNQPPPVAYRAAI